MLPMEILGWIGGNWFDLLQTAAITTGLFATVHNLRADRRERMVQTQFAITSGHREIWSKLTENPSLARVLDPDANLDVEPVKLHEEMLVQFVILHLRAAFKARCAGMDFADDNVELDVRLLFSLPIFNAVWNRSRIFQDADFVAFVEAALAVK
jgi:hypothetical protein